MISHVPMEILTMWSVGLDENFHQSHPSSFPSHNMSSIPRSPTQPTQSDGKDLELEMAAILCKQEETRKSHEALAKRQWELDVKKERKRQEAEENARREAEAKAWKEAEKKAWEEAEEKARQEELKKIWEEKQREAEKKREEEEKKKKKKIATMTTKALHKRQQAGLMESMAQDKKK
jgi:hypothetical protein